MEETLEEVQRKILEVEADIESINDAQRARGTPLMEREQAKLDVFNGLLLELRKNKGRLAAAATATGTTSEFNWRPRLRNMHAVILFWSQLLHCLSSFLA